jgi:hypothetical protein|nr:hypothetical protein [Neorhizobium tomejilense]
MLAKVLGKIRSVFSVETLLRYSERVGAFGCALPLLHFALLPFSVFFYVIREFLDRYHTTDALGATATFVIPVSAISGFYWLLVFWAHAAFFALLSWGLYRSLIKIFPPGTFAGAITRTLLAFTVTSGVVERFIAGHVMPMTLEGFPVSLTTAEAPAFNVSLYTDLGALVRSPYWEIGNYSITSKYAVVPLAALGLTVLVYLFLRIIAEVRIAIRDR